VSVSHPVVPHTVLVNYKLGVVASFCMRLPRGFALIFALAYVEATGTPCAQLARYWLATSVTYVAVILAVLPLAAGHRHPSHAGPESCASGV
jgi:hypothetical protein